MKIPDTNKIMSIAMLIGILIALYLIYKVFSGLGLIKTGAKKKEEKIEKQVAEKLRSNEYFDSELARNTKGYKSSFTKDQLTKIVKGLYLAMYGVGTDEEKIYTIFSQLKNKLQISEISYYYNGMYKTDLLTDLLNELTASEQVTLFNIIDQLPNK